MQPTARFLVSHPAHFLSLGFGSGLSPKAPGTAGTLLAWPLFPLINFGATTSVLALLAVLFAVGVWAAEKTGQALGVPDHGAIVWDEMVAMWLVLLFTPASLLWQAVAVLLFRIFDILKPPPIGWADHRVKGGFGVMLDDVIAALFAIIVITVLVWIVS